MTQPTQTNLADLLSETASSRPDDIAFLDASHGFETTWAALESSVDALAAGLLRQGLVAGDRVALLLGNRIEFVVSYFAILRAAMVAVPINTAFTTAEVTDLLARSGARLVVAEEATELVALEATRATPAELVLVGSTSFEALIRAGQRADAPHLATGSQAFDPESLAVLLFTSGTSGLSRGAMLTHRALLANIAQLRAIDPEPMLGDDVVLVVLPLFHIYALNAVLGLAVATGARSVLLARFSPETALEVIVTHGITHVPVAPPVLVAWARIPDLGRRLAGVRTVISGAAPLTRALFDTFTAHAGHPVWEGYGLTEAAPVVSSTMVYRRPKPGCVGSALPGVQVRLVEDSGVPGLRDLENSGEWDAPGDVEDGDPGEIWVRGPNLFSGYWPDGSDGPGPDGWYATGDIAYADDDGDLHLVDRRRDLVIVSGFNVYPFEIETVIASSPDVAEVAVIGIPHATTGETVKALVVALPGHTLTGAQVSALCESRLARFKCPTVVEIVESLPHSSTGKIARVRLRQDSL